MKKVRFFALSTCGWCKMTKAFLTDNSVEYEYVDVDKLDMEERELINKDIKNRGARLAFPTIIIDDNTVITGFKKDKLTEALGL